MLLQSTAYACGCSNNTTYTRPNNGLLTTKEQKINAWFYLQHTGTNYLICKHRGGGNACIKIVNAQSVKPAFTLALVHMPEIIAGKHYAACIASDAGMQACFDKYLDKE